MLFTILQVYVALGLIYTLILILKGEGAFEKYSYEITDITGWPILGVEIFMIAILTMMWAPAVAITAILRNK